MCSAETSFADDVATQQFQLVRGNLNWLLNGYRTDYLRPFASIKTILVFLLRGERSTFPRGDTFKVKISCAPSCQPWFQHQWSKMRFQRQRKGICNKSVHCIAFTTRFAVNNTRVECRPDILISNFGYALAIFLQHFFVWSRNLTVLYSMDQQNGCLDSTYLMWEGFFINCAVFDVHIKPSTMLRSRGWMGFFATRLFTEGKINWLFMFCVALPNNAEFAWYLKGLQHFCGVGSLWCIDASKIWLPHYISSLDKKSHNV